LDCADGSSSKLPGHLSGNDKVPGLMPMQSGLSAAVISLGKKLYSHFLSHPAVKLGTAGLTELHSLCFNSVSDLQNVAHVVSSTAT